MAEFLTKERELELGYYIQSYLKIKDIYECGEASVHEIEEAEKGISAIDELVDNNVRLVYKMANGFKKKYPGSADVEDLIQDGMLGMMKAIHKYDPTKGNKFSTYATWWIRQSITRTANETSRLVRLPENRIVEYLKMREIESTILDNGGTPAEAEAVILEELGLTSEKLKEIRAAASTHASLNKTVGGGESAKEFGEFFEDENIDLEENVLQSHMFSVVDDLLEDFTEIEKAVLASSFSLSVSGIQTLTPKEVKRLYKLSNSKFNSILNNSIQSLKESLDVLGLGFEDFLG